MGNATKKCPMCAEHIELKADVCQYCGARFEVSQKGYCTSCHGLVVADNDGRCTQCGAEVVDMQIESRFVGEEPVTTIHLPPPPTEQTPRRKRWFWACVVGFVVTATVAIIILSQLEVLAPRVQERETEVISAIALPTEIIETPTKTAVPEPTSTPTVTPTPPPPVAIDREAIPGIACFGTDWGATCLNEGGWKTYNDENSMLDNSDIDGLAVCPDGNLLFAQNDRVSVYDGLQWIQQYRNVSAGLSYSHDVACDSEGVIWLLHDKGLSSFDGAKWANYPTESLSEEYGHFSFTDMAISEGGDVWISVAQSTILRFDGVDWTVFREGQGFEESHFFVGVETDSQGIVWVASYDTLLMFDGNMWETFENPEDASFKSLFIDSINQVWLGTDHSFVVFQEGNWLVYPVLDEVAGGANVQVLCTDAGGRIWLGTNWGITIMDGEVWTNYHMHTADLAGDRIDHVLVLDGGPNLPGLVEKESGSLSGRILKDGHPAASTSVEICVEGIGRMYFGDTPCEKQAFMRSTVTNAEGEFVFEDILPGRYNLAFKTADGDWTRLADAFGISARWFLVEPGENTVIEDIKIKTD